MSAIANSISAVGDLAGYSFCLRTAPIVILDLSSMGARKLKSPGEY
jgi:hypothetical protein